MTVPLALITRLFQLISERKFAEAERVLERVTLKMKKTGNNDFKRGYLQALKGIILVHRTDDRYAFFSNLKLDDVGSLKKHRKYFLEFTQFRFHTDYDRGYFSAFADYMRVILNSHV